MSRFGWGGLLLSCWTASLYAQAPVTLGTPQAASRPTIVRGQSQDLGSAVRLAPPVAASRPASAPAYDTLPTWGATPAQFRTPEEAYNSGAVARKQPPSVPPPVTTPATPSADPFFFKEKPDNGSASYFGKLFGGENPNGDQSWWCGCDQEFNNFVSPITNPYLFEDPRALTEIRPIFTAQSIPGSTTTFDGGNIETLGVQARLAITNRLSFMITRLGGIWINPGDNSTYAGGSGLSELNLSAKYTFIRSKDTGTVVAAGAMFQLPVGPSKVFQDTGTASVVPFASIGQTVRYAQLGNFNFIDTLGYSQPLDNQRSAFFYNSFHIDYDILGNNHWFPLIELNWFRYTKDGKARTIGIEGAELINFGSTGVSGRDYLTFASGLRYKFTDNLILGGAVEVPVSRPKDLTDYRFTVDFIFRY